MASNKNESACTAKHIYSKLTMNCSKCSQHVTALLAFINKLQQLLTMYTHPNSIIFKMLMMWFWHIASFPSHSHLQNIWLLAVCRYRWVKAWAIWSSAETSGRQRVYTQGQCPSVVIPILCRTTPGAVNDKWYVLTLPCYVPASYPWIDNARKSFKILCWALSLCVYTLCIWLTSLQVTRFPRPSTSIFVYCNTCMVCNQKACIQKWSPAWLKSSLDRNRGLCWVSSNELACYHTVS